MKNVKGILFCGIIGIVAYFCGNYIPVVGGPVFGMIFGILLALILKKGQTWIVEYHLLLKKYYNMQ